MGRVGCERGMGGGRWLREEGDGWGALLVVIGGWVVAFVTIRGVVVLVRVDVGQSCCGSQRACGPERCGWGGYRLEASVGGIGWSRPQATSVRLNSRAPPPSCSSSATALMDESNAA